MPTESRSLTQSLQGLANTRVGTFTQARYDEAKKKDWTVISIKNNWKQIFVFDK